MTKQRRNNNEIPLSIKTLRVYKSETESLDIHCKAS